MRDDVLQALVCSLSLTFVVVSVVSCQSTHDKQQENRSEIKVTNSVAARTGTADDIIKIKMYDSAGRFSHDCTGTIVGHNTVLTAAHCVKDKSTARYQVTFAGKKSQWTTTHPGWTAGDPENERMFDIGIVVFKDSVASNAAVTSFRTIDTKRLKVNEAIWFAGYGALDATFQNYPDRVHIGCNIVNDVYDGYIRVVGIHRAAIGAPKASQNDLDCNASFNDANPGENSSAAPGDSGGPVLLFADIYKIVGVTSGGGDADSTSVEGYYATFARQDTIKFLIDTQNKCIANVCANIFKIE